MSLSSEQAHCPVCYPQDLEVVDILHRLARRISKQQKTFTAQKLSKVRNSAEQKSISSQNGVGRIIRFIFNSKFSLGLSCKHDIVATFLSSKTLLSQNRVEAVCEMIYQFQAKRNYEIEVLGSQIKCFPKSIGEELNRKNKKVASSDEKSENTVKEESEKAWNKWAVIPPPPTEYVPVETLPAPILVPYYFHGYPPGPFGSFYHQIN